MRTGFSFTEVLFAVMILGVGFIMVAAIFPVAIHQTKTTTEETTAAAIARTAASYLEQIATSPPPAGVDSMMPPTQIGTFPWVFKFQDLPTPLWEAVRGNLILADSSRYAWVPMYRREGTPGDPSSWSPYAQVFIVAVQVRNRSAYTHDDLEDQTNGQHLATFQPRPAVVRLIYDPDEERSFAVFDSAAEGWRCAAEGAYIIIARRGTGGPAGDAAVGRVYRLGNRDPDDPQFSWELAPGSGLKSSAEETTGAIAWIVGRGLADPALPFNANTNPYEGPAQDIAVYTTFIRVR